MLRLITINQSLWLDEAIGALAVRDFSFGGIVGEFLKFDNHPPLYYLALKFWTAIFGMSELSLRLPSVIFGVLTIYVVFKINGSMGEKYKKNAVFIAAILATSQIHVYYSQEARMYSMATFLVCLSVFLFLRTLNAAKPSSWILFALVNALIFLTDYLPTLIFPAFFVYAAVNVREKMWWKNFLLSFILPLAVCVLWLPMFMAQSEKGKWLLETIPKWRQTSGSADFKQIALVWMKYVFGRITLTNKNLYYFLVAAASVPFFVSFAQLLRRKLTKNFYLYWFFIPAVCSLFISLFIPAFNYFRIIFVLPAFYGLIICGWDAIGNAKIKRLILTSIFLVNISSLSIYYFDKSQKREDWKGAVGWVQSHIKPDEEVLFSYPEPFAPFRWYANLGRGATDSILATNKSIEITKDLIKDRNGIYYFEYLSGLSDPQKTVQTAIVDSNFREKNVYNFNGVGLVYYYVR